VFTAKPSWRAWPKVFEKHPDVYILSDEIYEHINFIGGHESIAQFDYIKGPCGDHQRLVESFCHDRLAHWLHGTSNCEIAAACDKMQGQITSGTCSITQRAGCCRLRAAGWKACMDMRDQPS
jgi:aspartate aminotransferase